MLSKNQRQQKTLQDINSTLESMSRTISKYGFASIDFVDHILNALGKKIEDEHNIYCSEHSRFIVLFFV